MQMSSAKFLSVTPPSDSSSPGLYVPVHRRRRGSSATDTSDRTDDMNLSSTSSRPSSRAESHTDSDHTSDVVGPVYSLDALLSLSKSPLARMPKEIKDQLRESVPEIVVSRKRRRAFEYWAMQQHQQQNPHQTHKQQQQAHHLGSDGGSDEGMQRVKEERGREERQRRDRSPVNHNEHAPQQQQRQQHRSPSPRKPNAFRRSWTGHTNPNVTHNAATHTKRSIADERNWRSTARPIITTPLVASAA